MRKVILVAVLLIVSLTLNACTPKNEPEENSSGSQMPDRNITNSSVDDPNATNSTANPEVNGSNSSAAGGNPDIANFIEVTVSVDKYFYENHEISYDDLIKVLDGLNENTSVKISDENATLKAYENLTKSLEERKILFVVSN